MRNIINADKLQIVQKKVNALQRKFSQDPRNRNMVALKRAFHRLLKCNRPNKQTIQSVIKLLLKLDPTLLSDGNAEYDKDDEYQMSYKGFFTRHGVKEAIDNKDIYDENSMNYDPCDMDQEQFKRVQISKDNIAHDRDCKYFAIIDTLDCGDDNLIAELPPRRFVMKYVKRVFKSLYPNEKIDTRSIYPSSFMKQILQIVLANRTFAGNNAKDLKVIVKQLFTRDGYANKKSRIHLSLYHLLKFISRHSKHLIDYNYNGASIIEAQNLFKAYCSRIAELYAKRSSKHTADELQDDLNNLNELSEVNKDHYLVFNQNINAFDLLTHHPDLIIMILIEALGIKLR